VSDLIYQAMTQKKEQLLMNTWNVMIPAQINMTSNVNNKKIIVAILTNNNLIVMMRIRIVQLSKNGKNMAYGMTLCPIILKRH